MFRAFTILSCGIIMSGIVVINSNLDWLASLFNFGTLPAFFFIYLSSFKLRKMMLDAARRSFKVPLYPYTHLCHYRMYYSRMLSERQCSITAFFFFVIGIGLCYFNKRGKAGLKPACL